MGVVAGLCATLALLPLHERALPALPISIVIGMAFYFGSTLLIAPLAQFGVDNSLFL